MQERDQALSTIRTALPIFKQINDLYLSAHNINQQVMMRQAKGADSNGKLSGIVAFFVAAICFFVLDILYRVIVRATQNGIVAAIWIVFSITLCIIVYIYTRRKIKNKPSFTNDELDAQSRQMERISNEIFVITTENQGIIDSIPRDYRYYDALVFFENALENGRADSMKEALNLYETYLHQVRMETNARLTTEMNRRQCEMLVNINEKANQAARNSSIAATFSILSFLK
ncbi:MAG: hypothetical protein MJ194_03000 [Clostridia bacterium]|nr:hypothetical protein [Clostridia bacterium]